MSKMSPSSSSSSCLSAPSRWCPTPEQVMILEEIYRNGLKTPNATQIQHITSHLSFYGKIEGKNVFYWFQNHKARDRQKLRRKLYKQLQLQHHHQMLLKRHRFDEHQFLQYFLHHQQRVPQQILIPNPGCFIPEDGEREEASIAKAEGGGGDGMMTAAEGGGSLRTLELFPVRGSYVKEKENGSGSGNNGLWRN